MASSAPATKFSSPAAFWKLNSPKLGGLVCKTLERRFEAQAHTTEFHLALTIPMRSPAPSKVGKSLAPNDVGQDPNFKIQRTNLCKTQNRSLGIYIWNYLEPFTLNCDLAWKFCLETVPGVFIGHL